MVCLLMNEPSARLDALVQLMSSRIDERGNWRVSSEELIAALEVDPVPFWRAVHASRDRIGFTEAVDGFSQETAGDLVTVLERFHGPRAEQALTRAGLFLPCELSIDLMEELFSRVERFAAGHRIGEDELAAMIAFAGSVSGAIAIYLDEHVDLEALIDECGSSFAAARGMPAAGNRTAARCLRDLARRHLIEKRSLLAGLERRLRLAARRLGYRDAESESQTAGAVGSGGRAGESRRAWATNVMGVPAQPLDAETLRRRYRELMKRYHPDINPSGLERCKEINAAYAVLMSREEKGDNGW
jgi:hypothetical protein